MSGPLTSAAVADSGIAEPGIAVAELADQAQGARDMSRNAAHLDDFEVIAERQRVMDALAVLSDRYRQLNQEITKRGTLRWMLATR